MKLTQNTSIPLGLAVLVFTGAGGWLTRMEMKLQATEQKVESADERANKLYNEICGRLRGIEQRLSGIEGELRRIKK